jgi:hypothetical protein
MQRIDILKKRQDMLKGEIAARLDSFLIGTIAKSPAMTGYGLTTKVKGKTISLYVRKGIVNKAQEMNRRYSKMWLLMQKLSKVNWEILNLENE